MSISSKEHSCVICMRSNHRNFFISHLFSGKRQDTIVLKKNHGFHCRIIGQFPFLVYFYKGFFQFFSLHRIWMIKQPHAILFCENTQNYVVQCFCGKTTCPKSFIQTLSISCRTWHLYVHTSLKCHHTCFCKVFSNVLHRMTISNSTIITHTDSIKSHLFS